MNRRSLVLQSRLSCLLPWYVSTSHSCFLVDTDLLLSRSRIYWLSEVSVLCYCLPVFSANYELVLIIASGTDLEIPGHIVQRF